MERTKTQFEAEVTHLSNQGYGVVKGPDRDTFFVRGTWPRDIGLFRVTDEREGNYGFAEIVSLLRPSPERRAVPCPHLGPGADQCFGCPWMMADEAAQLREKQHRVVYALKRVGLSEIPVETIWPSPHVLHYRRRAQFKTDGEIIGYAGRQGLRIAPIDNCLVLTPKMKKQLHSLSLQLPEPAWKPGPLFKWNYLDIDEDTDTLQLRINRRRPFQQANAWQNEAMRAWVKAQLATRDCKLAVLELFAGSGNFTEVLVDLGFASILAMEVGAEAIEQLQNKKWPGVKGQRMDLYSKEAAYTVARVAHQASILLANPPRAGLGSLCKIAQLLPDLKTLILISCDPVSFASDARRLIQQGFTAAVIQPLDQMPHTAHVEVIARFER